MLDDAAQASACASCAGRRLTDADEILIIARNHRTQEGNRREALERLTDLITGARYVAPSRARATRPTRASKERRLSTARCARGAAKKLRGRVRGDD